MSDLRWKLGKGAEIRVIAPSASWRISSARKYALAVRRLESNGYHVTFGENIKARTRLGTASVAQRITDLEAAYLDDNVKAILCLNGGWSSIELLSGIDWNIILRNPKPLIGFSDITVLVNAIYAKTGQTTLLGPTLSDLGSDKTWEMTLNALNAVLEFPNIIETPQNDGWLSDKKYYSTPKPWRIIRPGRASGILVGGNLGSLYLLQGTPYMPDLMQGIILAIEMDSEDAYTIREFDRRLESLLLQPMSVRAVLVGRFETSSRVNKIDVDDVIYRKFGTTIPILADVDFGHTSPMLTLPIGASVTVDTAKQNKLTLFT